MVILRLLGGASLESGENPITGRSAQRRRIALLALLASARRGLSRDRLIGYLWAESDDEKARRLLSESLYVLRKELGDDAILAAGDELRLNPAIVRCDVVEFDDAVSRGDHAGAAAIYAGAFLDGFYVNDAPELERWIEGERVRLARDFGRILERLAESATADGRHDDAVANWRRLCEQDPFSGRFAAGLMLALETAGHRAAALQHARTHATLLREELDADPDPEVVALAERLREAPEAGRSAGTRPIATRMEPAAAARTDPTDTLDSNRIASVDAPPPKSGLGESATVTFLFSDIEGSTALLRQLGPRYAELLATHHGIIRDTVRQCRGREVDTAGDGFFVAFARAGDAITAAARIQRMMVATEWPDGVNVRLRMGLHTGEPALTLTGYVGMDVHRASRICAAARGGQVLLSSATRELVAGTVPAGFDLRDLGYLALKDLEEPEHLYELAFRGGIMPATQTPSVLPQAAPATRAARIPVPGAPALSPPARRARRPAAFIALTTVAALALYALWQLSRPTAPLTYRGPAVATRTVVILPASVPRDPALADLRENLVYLLTTNLDGAGDLRIVDAYAVLAFAGDRDADLNLARTAARQFGARYSVMMRVVRTSPDQIQIIPTVYDRDSTMTSAGVPVPARSVAGNPTDLARIADGATNAILDILLGDQSTELDRTALRTSDSLEAIKAWLTGQRAFDRARYGDAADAFQRAVDIDSTFGLAHYRLSMASEWDLDFAAAHTSLARAVRHTRGLSLRQARLIRAWADLMEGNAASALATYEDITNAEPDNVEAWYGLGEARAHFNGVMGRPVTEAGPAFRRVLNLAANYGDARFHLLEFAAADQDVAAFDSLLAKMDTANDQWYAWQAVRAFTWGDATQRRAVEAELRRGHARQIGTAAVRVAAHSRDFAAARSLAALLEDRQVPTEWQAAGRILRAQLHFASGALDSANAILGAATAEEPDWSSALRGLFALPGFTGASSEQLTAIRQTLEAWVPGQRAPRSTPLVVHAFVHRFIRIYLLGQVSLRLKDDAAARRYLTELQRQATGPDSQPIRDILVNSLRAHIAAFDGQRQIAVGLLRNVERHGWIEQVGFSPFYSRAYDRLVLADLLRDDRQDDEALNWYRSLTEGYEVLFVAPAHYRMAQIHERLGQAESAQRHRDHYERLWGNADTALLNGVSSSARW